LHPSTPSNSSNPSNPSNLLYAVLLAALVTGACAGAPPDTTAADLEAIAAVRSNYVAALNAEDAEKVAALYTQDAVRMASILEGLKEMTAAWDCDISLKPEETVVSGNWAFDRGQYMLHMMPKTPGPDMIMDQGKYLVVLQKQADGTWQIAREIGNSNVPLPPPPAPPQK
jgi:uncharacterized protein (TIGR02246 family)